MLSSRAKTSLLVATGLTCALASSSFAQDGKASQAAPKAHVVAKLQLKDGSMVQFSETSPGELVTSIITPANPAGGNATINGVDVKKLSKLSASELYRALSGGQVAPAALVAAQQRVDQAKRAPRQEPSRNEAAPSQEPPTKLPSRATTERNSAIVANSDTTGAWFQANYCPTGGTSFNYCLLYQTGDGWITDDASFMQSNLYPIQGNVTHALQSQNCFLWMCSWHTDGQWTVPQGYVGLMAVSGPSKHRRGMITNGTGNTYHWALYGY